MQPVASYAELEDQRIAYYVMGEGPIDVVFAVGFFSAFDVEWEDPRIRLFHRRLTNFSRVIRFDRRGVGASDPLPLDSLPPWESYAQEIECVMDAAGSDEAAVIGLADAGPAALQFAATRPSRTRALALFDTAARMFEADDYACGIAPDEYEQAMQRIADHWGTDTGGESQAELFYPSRTSSSRFTQWLAKLQRGVSSPRAAWRYLEQSATADGRSLLGSIRVPTLVMQREDFWLFPLEAGRYLADNIDDAQLVEIPGSDCDPYWEHAELTLSTLEQFLTGIGPEPSSDRALASVLFTDIADSTALAQQMGDQQWRTLLDVHDETAHRVVEDYGGRVVKSTGDGILATFDGPGRAIRAGRDMRAQLDDLGLQIRTGIHTGEVEFRGDDVGGIGVHIAARVMGTARPGEILVSRTVKDLIAGSGISFEDRGTHDLKGIDGEWQLLAVAADVSDARANGGVA